MVSVLGFKNSLELKNLDLPCVATASFWAGMVWFGMDTLRGITRDNWRFTGHFSLVCGIFITEHNFC